MPIPEPEVVKWYTRARKFPQLIGRTPDGAKIWGGPYTFTQVVGAGVVLFVGVNTMGLWAGYGLIGNAMILLGVAYGVVLLLGRVPVGSRSPVAVLLGCIHAVSAPPTGRIAGRPVRIRRPHTVRHRITVLLDPAGDTSWASRPAVADPAVARPPLPLAETQRARPALTGVQQLLARAGATPGKDL